MANEQYSFLMARRELCRRLGGRNDTISVERAGEHLNSAQLQLAKCRFDLPRFDEVAVITVGDGQSEVNLANTVPVFATTDGFPSTDMETQTEARSQVSSLGDILGILYVQNITDQWQMTRFPWREWRAIQLHQASGQPIRWARRGHVLALDPAPDTATELRIDYRRRPTLDRIEVDGEWYETLLALGESIGWRAYGQPDLAKAALTMVPANVLNILQTPLDGNEWEAMHDEYMAVEPWQW